MGGSQDQERLGCGSRWRRCCYTLFSSCYDGIIGPLDVARGHAIELLQIAEGDEILLVGVGTGSDLAYLPTNAQYKAIDVTPAMLSQCEERANEMSLEIECTLMDAEHLTYPDDAFDAVVLNLILSVVPNPNDCVGEVQRVLKPGGRVVVYDKFLSEGQQVSCGRKCGNLFANCVFTDMNRRLEEILEGSLFATTGDEVVEGLPGRLEGMYRIVTLRNDKNVDVGNEIVDAIAMEVHEDASDE